MKIKKFNEFDDINEGLLSNLFSKLKGYLSDGLKELMKDTKSGDPKKMIKSLKKYVQLNGQEMDKKLTKIKTEKELKDYLNQTIYGLYSAIKGIQSTEKIDPAYFNDMFKKADKNFTKLMNMKPRKFDKSLETYINDILLPGLKKLAGERDNEEKDKSENNQEESQEENQGKDNEKESQIEVSKKLKKVTKTWLGNILSPIMDKKEPKGDGNEEDNNKDTNNKKIIKTKDDSVVRRKVVQDITKNADLNQIKKFREMVGKSSGVNNVEKKWPVGK